MWQLAQVSSSCCAPDHKVAHYITLNTWKTFKEEAKKNIHYGIFEIKQTLNHITMSEKHRNLPPWMVKSDVQSSKDSESVKKKTRGETTKRIAKKRLER